jgi:hypothetical protein
MEKLKQRIKNFNVQRALTIGSADLFGGPVAGILARRQPDSGLGLGKLAGLSGNLFRNINTGGTELADSKILANGEANPVDGVNKITPTGTRTRPILTSRVANNQTVQNTGFINDSIAQIDNANQVQSQNEQTGLETRGNIYNDGTTQTTYRSKYGEGLSAEDNSYLRTLDNMMLRADAASRSMMNQIKSNYSNRQAKMQEINDKYQSGLESAGIRSGSAQYTPQLFDEQIRNAEIASQENLAKLDQEEMFALTKAQQQMQDNQFKLANEQVKYIKEVRAAKAQELQNQLKLQWEMKKFYKTQENKMAIENAKLGLGYAKLNYQMSKGSGGGSGSTLKPAQKKASISSAMIEAQNYLDDEGNLTKEGFDMFNDGFSEIGIPTNEWVSEFRSGGIMPGLSSKRKSKKYSNNYGVTSNIWKQTNPKK